MTTEFIRKQAETMVDRYHITDREWREAMVDDFENLLRYQMNRHREEWPDPIEDDHM